MCQLHGPFKTTITASQAIKLFMQKKYSKRTWAEHYLYMVAVSDAREDVDSRVLNNVVHHASPELINVMRAKYDSTRVDYYVTPNSWRALRSRLSLAEVQLDAKSSLHTLTRSEKKRLLATVAAR